MGNVKRGAKNRMRVAMRDWMAEGGHIASFTLTVAFTFSIVNVDDLIS